MIRLILRLLGIKDFEVCQSCETLKEQLSYERDEKKRLTDTLIAIVSPKPIELPAPIEMNPIALTTGNWARKRTALEARDREEAKIIKESKHIGKEDSLKEIETLEKELDIPEQKEA